MGSGSTLVAAAILDRRYVGYDLDADYVALARQRVADALSTRTVPDAVAEPPALAGETAHRIAEEALLAAGYVITGRNRKVPGAGLSVAFVAEDAAGDTWRFDVCGPNTSRRGGLARLDAVWRALGRAGAVRGSARAGSGVIPLVLLTTALPRSGEPATALRAAGPHAFFDAIELGSDDGRDRLERYAKGGFTDDPQPGFWNAGDIDRLRR